jgi:putative acetyltransferase
MRRRDLDISRVTVDDHSALRRLVSHAFGTDGPETVEYLDDLRADGCIVAEWLVRDRLGPMGHIVYSRVWLEAARGLRKPAVMLTPLCVRPDRQRQGIGLRLISATLAALECCGETLCFVIGHPDYYPRAGFGVVGADVQSPWRGQPYFMARSGRGCEGRLIVPDVIANAH